MARKGNFFDRPSFLNINDLGLALGMALKFSSSVEEGLKTNVRMF